MDAEITTGKPTASKKFIVVALSGAVPIHLSPRGQRTLHLMNALQAYGQVERVGGDNIPQWLAGSSERKTSSWYRQLVRRLVYRVLIDKYEISVWRELRRWRPSADVVVLVAHPCSHLSIAARKLSRKGIPFVVDIGDPWILTNSSPEVGGLSKWRAQRQERRVWNLAAGVIVTTQAQGDALRELFPHLRVLVRPNGYSPIDDIKDQRVSAASTRDPNELHLVHYGSLYGRRVNFRKIFQRLSESGKWQKITLHQYGSDWEGALESISDTIEIDHRSPISWAEVIAGAHAFDAAVVIGWRNVAQMPSKTVQYLTLPIPRIAISTSDDGDALAAYVADRPGWALIDDVSEQAAQIVADHVAKQWSDTELQAPKDESWAGVERLLGAFVNETTSGI
jgi:hypothetical protein